MRLRGRWNKLWTAGMLALFMILATVIVLAGYGARASAATGVYKTINFQGKVVNTNGTNVPDASYTFKFRIYSSPSGDTSSPCASTCVWEESKSLTTVNGIFQTNLGDTTTLPGSVNFNTDNLYVAVVFNGDTEMTPRIRLTSVPYAFNADMLDGLDSSALVQLSPASQQTGAINVSGNITTAGNVNATGSVNAASIDANVAGALQVGGANATSITLAKNTNLSSGLTLSLQGSNALSLGSTTAAGGIVFRDGTGNNRSVTLAAVGVTASYSLNLPSTGPSAGLQCLQTASGSSVNLAFGSCGAGGTNVSLQAGSPGTADTGNFNITGIGIAAAFDASTFDRATAGLLNIGTTTANQIIIGKGGLNITLAGTTLSQSIQVQAGQSVSFVAGAGNFDQSASTGTFATGTGAVTINGDESHAAGKSVTYAAGTGNFDQSASTGTHATGSGAVSLNGNTTVAGTKSLTVTAGVSLLTGLAAGSSTAVTINTGASSNYGAIVKGATSQAVDLFQLQDVSGNVNGAFNSTGNQLTLGRVAATGTVTAGNLLFADGTTDNFSATIKIGGTPLTASQTVNIGNQSGTICLQSSTACGFAVGNTGSYIQNQIAGAQTSSNFWINGTGAAASFQASTNVLTPLLDTPAGITTLAIGTTNATSGINLNQNTALAAGKNLTFAAGAGGFDQSLSTGTFKTGSGAVSLNGDTTTAAGKSLTYAAGAGNFDQSQSTGTFKTGSGVVTINGSTTIASGKTLAVGGDTTIKSSSTTAFQIQNTAGTATMFGFDSTNGNITIGSGATRTIAVGASAASTAGNNLALTGGTSGTGAVNGGNLVLSGGVSGGSGVQGLVSLASTAFGASALQTNSIAAGLVDQYSTIPVTANSAGLTVNVPVAVNAVTGRILYVTAASGSNDFTILLGGTSISIAMKQNSTATLIWNGTGWTAAGASSSTDLQSAYNNTLTSAGGAELVLNGTGGNADGFTIRNNATSPISGALLEVQSSIGTNLFSVNNSGTELAANGGAETSGTFAAAWTTYGTSTITRNTTLANVATGQASVQAVFGTAANNGVRNNLTATLASGSQYQVSFTAELTAGSAITDFTTGYSRDGTASGATGIDACTSNSTQMLSATWAKITCLITPTGTTTSNNDLIIRQVATAGSARTVYIDNLSVTLLTTSSTPPNVQIGGGLYGGAPTLLTLDRSSSPPVGVNNTALLGSMYYDTTSGRIQCYEADGWGACGSSPDNYVNLVPEFPGAVLDGSGIGTLTSDFCSNQSGVLSINSTLCSTGQALNYYKWTSPQATQQTYSVYVTYQLPAAFKQFQSDSTVQLTARTDNTTNGVVSYEMFRSESGALSACGTETTVTSTANTWQTVGINGNELTSCGFSSASANNFAIFKINVKANSNANVYIGTLSFTTTGQ